MKTLCINLDSRPDRWAQASAEFDRVGLTVERVSAVSGDNKPLAFNQSVYKCMEMASGQDLMLFEDDVVFDNTVSGMVDFTIPDALSLHLGCNIMGQWDMPIAFNEHAALLLNCWQSHATWYSKECVEIIVREMDPFVISETQPIFDEWFRINILPLRQSYVCKPMVCYQRPSFSDIWNTQADYTQCHIDGNRYLASL